MPEEKMKFEIEVDLYTLTSCFDLLDITGRDWEGESLAQIIGDLLLNMVEGLREEKIVPSYNSDNDIEARLLSCLERTREYEPQKEPISVPEPDTLLGQIEDSMQVPEETPQLEIPEQTEEEDNETELLSFSNLPEKDPLVIEAKGDSLKESALVNVYVQLSQELWGSDKARSIWMRTLKNLGKHSSESNNLGV